MSTFNKDQLTAALGLDMGLGANLKLSFGAQDHKGFDSIYSTVIRDGTPEVIPDSWVDLAAGQK